jgi:hypothetical protein
MYFRCNVGMEDQEIRRQRLRAWINANLNGNEAELARQTNRKPSQISDTLAGRKSFGEKLARSIERKLRMPKDYLDNDGDVASLGLPADVTALIVAYADLLPEQQERALADFRLKAAENRHNYELMEKKFGTKGSRPPPMKKSPKA